MPSSQVLNVTERAPEGSPRESLRTKMVARSESPHEAFNAYNGVHDICREFTAYAEDSDGTGDQDDAEEVQVRKYVVPTEFHAYEFRNRPGELYLTATDNTIKQMFRRYRNTEQRLDVTLNQREVQLKCLNEALKSGLATETFGYVFSNVPGQTAITKMDLEGPHIDENQDVQNARDRAENVRTLTFLLQVADRVLKMRVTENGAVTFADYPGDETALSILEVLESYIQQCSDLSSITVVQGRNR